MYELAMCFTVPCFTMRLPWNRHTKRLTIAAFSSAVCLLLLVVGLWLIREFVLYGKFIPKPMDFESTLWKTTPATHNYQSIRLRMVDNLLKTHPLVGLSRAEVEKLLGPADQTTYFHEFDMVYMLGLERGMMIAIDSEWLIIKLDSSGRVSRAVLARD